MGTVATSGHLHGVMNGSNISGPECHTCRFDSRSRHNYSYFHHTHSNIKSSFPKCDKRLSKKSVCNINARFVDRSLERSSLCIFGRDLHVYVYEELFMYMYMKNSSFKSSKTRFTNSVSAFHLLPFFYRRLSRSGKELFIYYMSGV